MSRPNFVAKKSTFSVLNVWLILFFWLIIPLIIQIVRIVIAKHYVIEFYNQRIVVKSGVIAKHEKQTVFAGVYSVTVSQSLVARIFGYGNITVDCPGKWDIDTVGIKDPMRLKRYLTAFITTRGMNNVIINR